MVRKHIEVVVSARSRLAHPIDSLDLLVNAAKDTICLGAVGSMMMGCIIIRIVVAEDRRRAPVHVNARGERLDFPHENVRRDMQEWRENSVSPPMTGTNQAVELPCHVAGVFEKRPASNVAES